MQQFGFALAESADSLDLDIYSAIGESFWGDAVSAKDVRSRLKSSSAKTINVRINSEGGDVFQAADIYDQLKAHSARKVMRVGGLAASAASYILMAGDEIIMGAGAWLMLHNPWGMVAGEGDDLRSWADVLDKMRGQYAAVYAARSKQPREKVLDLMAAETWLTADDAVALGFADRIDAAEKLPQAKTRARACFAAAALRDFSNVPQAVLDMGAAKDNPAPVAKTPTGEDRNMTTPQSGSLVAFVSAIGLTSGATEADILARCNRLRELERDAMALAGVEDSAQTAGALRGMKAKADLADALRTELGTVKGERDQQNFSALIAKGKSAPIKLTPASAKFYEDRFLAAVPEGRGADIVSELRGFLDVAPTIISTTHLAPAAPTSATSGGSALLWDGKTYAAMTPIERHRLWQSEPELFAAMKRDHETRAA